jgi:hypothetical protein
MSGVSGLPVAPLRSTPWQPAQRSKKISEAWANSVSLMSGAPGVRTCLTASPLSVLGAPSYAAWACEVPGWLSPCAGSELTPLPARTAATWAALTGSPPFSQEVSTKLRMAAISSSPRWLMAGITLLYLPPLTVISPVTPASTAAITSSAGLPLSQSEPASGGNAPGKPWPVGWWQAAHCAR